MVVMVLVEILDAVAVERYDHRGGFDGLNKEQVLLKHLLFLCVMFILFLCYVSCGICGLPPFVGFDSQKTFIHPFELGICYLFVYIFCLFFFVSSVHFESYINCTDYRLLLFILSHSLTIESQ